MMTRAETITALIDIVKTQNLDEEVEDDIRYLICVAQGKYTTADWIYENAWLALDKPTQAALLYYQLVQTHTDPHTGLELPNGVGL